MTHKITLVFLACLFLTSAVAEDATWNSQRGLFVVSYQSELEPIEINKLHAWVIHIENPAGEPIVGAMIEASGGMPVHDHGLPTRPRVIAELGNGNYKLDGLRFHMAGEWEITMIIVAGGRTDTVVVALKL